MGELLLSLKQDRKKQVIAYYSQTSLRQKKLLHDQTRTVATRKAIKRFRLYLNEQKYWSRTEGVLLSQLCRKKKLLNQFAYLIQILAKFSYLLEHWAEQKHGSANGLSRQPCKHCRQCEFKEMRDGGHIRQELDSEEQVPDLKTTRSKELLCNKRLHWSRFIGDDATDNTQAVEGCGLVESPLLTAAKLVTGLSDQTSNCLKNRH